jgi:hypothetical protein
MPELEWSINATVRSDVTVVYDAETLEPVDVSKMPAPAVIAMLVTGTHLLKLSDHYNGIRDCEHEEFWDIDAIRQGIQAAIGSNK